MVEFYLRENDPFLPVYEVDREAGTWKLVGSTVGVADVGGSIADDGGASFKTDQYAQVWKKAESNGMVTFSRECPSTS